MKIKVMTFNIQHGRNHNLSGDVIDLPLMAENIISQNPDIVGLNEVRCGKSDDHSSGYSDQARFFAKALGGECRFGKAISINDDCGYGNAIFSRYRMSSFEVIPIPDAAERLDGYYYETRCIIRSEYDFDGRKLTVLNAHFGLGPQEQDNAVDTVLAIARGVKTPIVLMGDFNMTPDNANVKRLSEYFTDVHTEIGKSRPTFPSDAPNERIDYIFTKRMKTVSADTVERVVSDHYAITAELEF